MSVESEDDRLIFLNNDEFARPAQVWPRQGGESYLVPGGIFDERSVDFNPNRWPGTEYQRQLGAHFVSTDPRYKCRSVDVPLIKTGDHLVMEGDPRRFRVEEKLQDGTGFITLLLREADEE